MTHYSKNNKFSSAIEKVLKKFSVPPKIRVIPIKKTKEEYEKAKLLSALIEHNWSEIDERISKEIVRPMARCYLYGKHKWIGCGKKDRHVCRICGRETGVLFDPIYYSF
jgi:1-aminocyclopropane-1-carboxylate deaminase/D-cysteine desulfhydrase-like pyridoxal-dependent ACC family enzyme